MIIEDIQVLRKPCGEVDDHALIRRVASGDTTAFETLYQHYAPRLRGYLLAQLGEPDLADDACQEVLLVVWTTAERFQYASQLSTWIFGIAWRIANRVRKKARSSHGQLEHDQSHLAVEQNPAHELERQARQRVLAQGFKTLPDLLRRTVELRYELHYSSQEIAREMRCSVSQVNYRLGQAQRRLAAFLRRQEAPIGLAV